MIENQLTNLAKKYVEESDEIMKKNKEMIIRDMDNDDLDTLNLLHPYIELISTFNELIFEQAKAIEEIRNILKQK